MVLEYCPGVNVIDFFFSSLLLHQEYIASVFVSNTGLIRKVKPLWPHPKIRLEKLPKYKHLSKLCPTVGDNEKKLK